MGAIEYFKENYISIIELSIIFVDVIRQFWLRTFIDDPLVFDANDPLFRNVLDAETQSFQKIDEINGTNREIKLNFPNLDELPLDAFDEHWKSYVRTKLIGLGVH